MNSFLQQCGVEKKLRHYLLQRVSVRLSGRGQLLMLGVEFQESLDETII